MREIDEVIVIVRVLNCNVIIIRQAESFSWLSQVQVK